jgi:hypothetical protein
MRGKTLHGGLLGFDSEPPNSLAIGAHSIVRYDLFTI